MLTSTPALHVPETYEPDGTFRLRWDGTPAEAYEVQESADPNPWTNPGTWTTVATDITERSLILAGRPDGTRRYRVSGRYAGEARGWSESGAAVTLRARSVTAPSGSTSVPVFYMIELAAGAEPSGLRIEWRLPQDVSVRAVLPGPAAETASKSVNYTTAGGRLTVEISGPANAASAILGPGQLFVLLLDLELGAASGVLAVESAACTDLTGRSLSIQADPAPCAVLDGTPFADLNGDGATDVLDLQALLKAIRTGTAAPSGTDLDGSGVPDATDVELLVDYITGKPVLTAVVTPSVGPSTGPGGLVLAWAAWLGQGSPEPDLELEGGPADVRARLVGPQGLLAYLVRLPAGPQPTDRTLRLRRGTERSQPRRFRTGP